MAVGAVKFEIARTFFINCMDQTELKFIHQTKTQGYFKRDDRVLAAVSGGSDSMALLSLLLHLPISWRPTIQVATVDFDLRTQSVEEVDLVRQFCKQYALKFHTIKWQHSSDLKAMEVQARNFRYSYFAQIMKQEHLNKLVTAHQSDDQVETILMKLIRSGSVWESQGIMAQRTFAVGQLIRPLLEFSKSELIEYLQRQHLQYAVDDTNFQDITLRNRLRQQVIPILHQENPRLSQHLATFAAQSQSFQQIIQNYFSLLRNQAIKDHHDGWIIDLRSLEQLPFLGKGLFIQYFVHQKLPFDLTARQLEQLQHILMQKKGHIDLPSNWVLDKNNQELLLQPKSEILTINEPIDLQLNQTVFANAQQKITIKQVAETSAATFYFPRLPQNIVLRARRPGDRVRLLNGQHQQLKKRLTDLKVPYWQRQNLWLLTFDDEIVWVPNIYRYQIRPTSYLFEIIIGE